MKRPVGGSRRESTCLAGHIHIEMPSRRTRMVKYLKHLSVICEAVVPGIGDDDMVMHINVEEPTSELSLGTGLANANRKHQQYCNRCDLVAGGAHHCSGGNEA